MKSALPWILVVVLLGGGYFLYSANKAKEAELAALGPQQQELETLRAENAELKKLPAQQEEIARLRKDNEELLSLRSQVQKLRDESRQVAGQLSAAQAQAAHAQRTQEQVSAENQALREQAQKMQGQVQNAAKPADSVSVCVNNLRMIDAAKQQWALENKKQATDVPTLADISTYFPPGTQLVCPTDGTYAINAVNTPPTCSIPGHVLR